MNLLMFVQEAQYDQNSHNSRKDDEPACVVNMRHGAEYRLCDREINAVTHLPNSNTKVKTAATTITTKSTTSSFLEKNSLGLRRWLECRAVKVRTHPKAMMRRLTSTTK